MNDKTIEFLVNKDDELDRLDLFLKSKMNPISRSSIKKFIDQGLVNLNGIQEYSSSKKLKNKDKVQVQILTKSELKIIPSNLPIKIVYEDESLLVIDKEAGMVVHPGAGNKKDTLVNALIHKFENTLSTLSGNDRPGIVHRIDKETSGLIVVAKDNISHQKLSDQFSDKMKKQLKKEGLIQLKHGEYEYPISYQLIKDGQKNKVLNKKINLDISVTMVHGNKDKSVPIIYSKKILRMFKNSRKKLVIVKNGDHSLSSPKFLKILKRELKLIAN